MKCPVCAGKGTMWIGVEAETECGSCKGSGEACDECAKLTRERDEAREQRDKANAIRCKDCEVRKHFRRACELLDKYSWRPGEHKSAEEWMAEVERLEGKP